MNKNKLMATIKTLSNNYEIIDLLKQNLSQKDFDTLMNQLATDYQIELMVINNGTHIPMWTDSTSGIVDDVSVIEFKSIILDYLT